MSMELSYLSSLNLGSWIAIVLLVISAVRGLHRGMVRTLFATFTFLIALILAVVFSPRVNTYLQESSLYERTSQRIERALEGNPALITGEEDETLIIEGLPVPEFVRDALVENNEEGMYSILGVDTFHHFLSTYLTRLLIRVLSFLLVFIAAVIALRLLCALLDAVAGLPVLHTMNKLGGLVFGLVNGMLLLWFLCSIAALFSGTGIGALLNRQINESIVLNTIYNKNILLTLAAGLRKLGLPEGLRSMIPL